MALRQRIISEIYDEKDSKIVDRNIIVDKEIKKPKNIENLGHNHGEQIDILQKIQDCFLFIQSDLMGPNQCPTCGAATKSAGSALSDFHSVYTDHKLQISRKRCCNKLCEKRNILSTVYSLFGSNMHPDLVEKQAKLAASCSFMNAQRALEAENGKYRKINNQLTIKKTSEKVGEILAVIHTENSVCTEKSAKLIAQVDGGYVKSKDRNKRNFEVLVSNVYKPENHIHGGMSKNDIRTSGKIIEKIYSASSLKDRGKTIKAMLISSAKKQGMYRNTKIVALSDGANNCWSTLKSLEKHCDKIEYILDWYHIRQKFDALSRRLDASIAEELESIKWKVWHGKSQEAISILTDLYGKSLQEDYAESMHDLLKYLSNNREYLISYEVRKREKLVYTSSIIESTVETLVNSRHKKKHKAQWSREGAHNILQIRSSIASHRWKEEWNVTKTKFYKHAA